MASVTATVSIGRRRRPVATRRLGTHLGDDGIGTGVEASNGDVLLLGCDRLGLEGPGPWRAPGDEGPT